MLFPKIAPFDYDVLRILDEYGQNSGSGIRHLLKIRGPKTTAGFYYQMEQMRKNNLIERIVYKKIEFGRETNEYFFKISEVGLKTYIDSRRILIFKPVKMTRFPNPTNATKSFYSYPQTILGYATWSIAMLAIIASFTLLFSSGLLFLELGYFATNLLINIKSISILILIPFFLFLAYYAICVIFRISILIVTILIEILSLMFIITIGLLAIWAFVLAFLQITRSLHASIAIVAFLGISSAVVFVLSFSKRCDSPERLTKFVLRFAIPSSKEILDPYLQLVLSDASFYFNGLQNATFSQRIRLGLIVIGIIVSSGLSALSNFSPSPIRSLKWHLQKPFW